LRRIESPFEAWGVLRTIVLLILLICFLAGCGAASIESRSGGNENRDSSGARENKEASIVSGMSLRDMVGQMFVVSVGGTEPDYYIEKMVRKRNIGGVILFGCNMKSEEQVQSLAGSLQNLSLQTEPPVPLFVAVDQEGVT
jgi:beta-N-acetylhexosaminidase